MLTLVEESMPGVIAKSVRIKSGRPFYAGFTRSTVTTWSSARKWRSFGYWLTSPPPHYRSFSQPWAAPFPGAVVSDGHNMWDYDPAKKVVTVYPPFPNGTVPPTDALTRQFVGWGSLHGILTRSHYHCSTPVLRGTARVAGQATYKIDFGQDRCLYSGVPAAIAPAYLRGRVVVWIDQRTLFALRVDRYAYGKGSHLLMRSYVAYIRYNVNISPVLFRLTVPQGYRVVHASAH